MKTNSKIIANIIPFQWRKKGMFFVADNGTVWLLHDHHRYLNPIRDAVRVKVGECEKSVQGVLYDY